MKPLIEIAIEKLTLIANIKLYAHTLHIFRLDCFFFSTAL